jgi:hypothetical protein
MLWRLFCVRRSSTPDAAPTDAVFRFTDGAGHAYWRKAAPRMLLSFPALRNQVAFGAKRKSTGGQYRPARLRMTHNGHSPIETPKKSG